jgi:lipoprotein NlpI
MKLLCSILLTLLSLGGGEPLAAEPTSAEPPAHATEIAGLKADVQRLTAALAVTPDSIRLLSQRGDALLFLGRFQESVADFEKMIALDPAQDAPHWRLGIAYYYAGDFAKSSAQFLKYQTYEAGDRENGIWKFMADVPVHGLEKARTMMVEYTRFDREPFPDLYRMFAGTLTGDEVLAALKAKGLARDGAPQFFAHYYVGVNEGLLGRREQALALLNKAVDSTWGRTAEGGPAYMWRCARLHRDQLAAKAVPAAPAATK